MTPDQLFKILIRLRPVLRAFFELFVPAAAAFIDFERLEFVDKERFTLDGQKREGDILIKAAFRDQEAAFLLHLESQGQSQSSLPKRLLEYVVLDWREFGLPVYPIVVVGCEWPGAASLSPVRMDFPNKRVLEFNFDVIELDRMAAWEYVRRDNPAALAFSGQMRVEPERRIELAVEFLLSLAGVELGEEEKEVVAGFFFGHLRLQPEEQLQLNQALVKVLPEQHAKIMMLTNPFTEQGVARGRREEALNLVLRMLRRRLGSLGQEQEAVVNQLSLEQLEGLGEALLDFKSAENLNAWLSRNR